MEIILLLFVIAVGISVFGVLIYYCTRRGEKCRGYPYNCPVCRHAAELKSMKGVSRVQLPF